MKNICQSLLWIIVIAALLVCAAACGADDSGKTVKIKALIVPKFEIGAMSGDDIGEAQLLYEKYFPEAEEILLSNLPGTAHFYVNEKNGAALLVTGSGKTACALALTAVLTNRRYDFSGAFLISVGCAGGSAGVTTLGDIVLVTGACDNELGHTADIREFEHTDSQTTWFPDSSYDGTSSKLFSADLVRRVYSMVQDVPLNTTEKSQQVLAANFANEEWALRRPKVILGTALSGDSFWKGSIGHNNAQKITDYYQMPDPYAVTEMEELTVANTAACYGMLNRVISLRAVVDLDVFLGEDSPESLWTDSPGYNQNLGSESSTALDIFEPAMKSLFDVSETVIDAILAGDLTAD